MKKRDLLDACLALLARTHVLGLLVGGCRLS